MAPRPGLWKGTIDPDGYPGSVSFKIDTEGNIRSFDFHMNFGFGNGCIITADKIEIGADQKFSYTFGEPVDKGGNLILGEFSDRTTVTGTVSNSISCLGSAGKTIYRIASNRIAWRAQLDVGE